MLADLVSMFVMFAIFGAPMAFFARCLLRRHAKVLGVAPEIGWIRLILTTIVSGSLFASVWLVPVIYLLPPDQGPQKEGPIYVAGMALLQTLALMPIICALPSVACRFLPTPSGSGSPHQSE